MNLMELFVKIGVNDEASAKISDISSKVGHGLATAAKLGGTAVAAAGTAVVALAKQSIDAYAEHEQLAGGVQKIFDEMDTAQILNDADEAYKNLNMSANQHLSIINSLGAAFASTMGDEAGYNTAKQGLQAISDYASGTGRSVDELSEKYQLITRSAGSYQSIADQFSGILPATSKAFLEQAQAAGLLSEEYTELTQVPIEEYQAAVTEMLAQGVDALGLTGNTAAEAFNTISGSMAATKSAWEDVVASFANGEADLSKQFNKLAKSASALIKNLTPTIKQALSGISSFVREMSPIISEELPALVAEAIPMVVDSASTLIDALVTALPDLIQELVDVVPDIVSNISDMLVDNTDTLLDAALELIVSLGEGLVENIDELSDAVVQIIEKLSDFFAEEDNINKIIDVGLDLILAIVDGLVNNVEQLAEGAVKVAESLATELTKEENLQKIIDAGVALVGAVGEGLINSADTLIEGAWSIIKTLAESLVNGDMLTYIGTAAGRITITFVRALVEKIGEVLNFSDALMNEITAGLDQAESELIAAGESAAGLIGDGVEEQSAITESSGTELANALVVGLTNETDQFVAAGTTSASEFATGVENGEGSAKTAGTVIANASSEPIKSLSSKSRTWGVDMVQNFIDGIYSMEGSARAAAQSIAGTVEANLGFSEPEEGPLSNFHTYAPDMIDLWNKTLAANDYKLRDQIRKSFDFRDIIEGATATFSVGDAETTSTSTGFSIVQNFYNNDRPTAADLFEEARYNARQAVMFGV